MPISNLITNVLRTTECNLTCSLEQENHISSVWLQAERIAGALSMRSIHSPDYVSPYW